MRFKCKPVSMAELASSSALIVNQVDVNATPERIFEVFEDAESWAKWVDAIEMVEWTSPKPFGTGTTRTVTLNGVVADERFISWVPGERITFYFTATSLPFAQKFCEDYQLEDLGDNRTRLFHSVLYKPNLLTLLLAPFIKSSMKKMFHMALLELSLYLGKSH